MYILADRHLKQIFSVYRERTWNVYSDIFCNFLIILSFYSLLYKRTHTCTHTYTHIICIYQYISTFTYNNNKRKVWLKLLIFKPYKFSNYLLIKNAPVLYRYFFSFWYDIEFKYFSLFFFFQVTVVRQERAIDKAFTISVAILVSVIYINFGCAVDWLVMKSTIKRPIGPVIGLFAQFFVMPLVSNFK